jgi:hypothetical protein
MEQANIAGRPVSVAGAAAQGESQFVVSLADGGLVHTRYSGGHFTAATTVKDKVGGAIGNVVAVAAAAGSPGMTQYMFSLADGRLLHTTYRSADSGWYPAGDVKPDSYQISAQLRGRPCASRGPNGGPAASPPEVDHQKTRPRPRSSRR